MPLTPEHKRQIAQFMLIAEHYFSLAGPAAHERETLGMTKHVFMPSNPVTAATVKLAIVGAHLSSAAIRLTSIEGVLEVAHNANPSYRRCRDYFNGKTSMPDNDLPHIFILRGEQPIAAHQDSGRGSRGGNRGRW